MFVPNPIDLAERQLTRDKNATSRFHGMFEHKLARMAASPLSYLRGAAPLFYELLSEHPELREGPAGTGWLCGDAHIENFGVYRTERRDKNSPDAARPDPVVFDVNDFDETVVGPFRFDVLRLVTSLILGGRELGADGKNSLALSARLLDAYAGAAFEKARLPAPPGPVRRLLEKVEHRTQRDLLDRRTEVVKDVRQFIIGERYATLPKSTERAARAAFENYAAKLADTGFAPDHFKILDVAFRVAGTGSLGTLRVAVLTRGKGGPDGAWIFDMKEESASSAAALVEPLDLRPAKRVLSGVRACLEHPPRMIGTTKLDDASMFVRRLAPQEDKLDLTAIDPKELGALAEFLGALLGRAHCRGATELPPKSWSTKDRLALIDRAIVIAGLHEATYLSMCRAL